MQAEVDGYLQALLQGTSGGRPGPISPRRNEPYGLLGMLANTRAAERLFREGREPDPAKQDNATGG